MGGVIEIIDDYDFVTSFKEGKSGEGANVAAASEGIGQLLGMPSPRECEPGDEAGPNNHNLCHYPRQLFLELGWRKMLQEG